VFTWTNGPIRLWQNGTDHSFFTNIWLAEPNVREKDRKSTMLPQAILAFRSGTRMEQAAPRKSCK
jgi:hypothetical protein